MIISNELDRMWKATVVTRHLSEGSEVKPRETYTRIVDVQPRFEPGSSLIEIRSGSA
jgi:hypothetical protein